MKRTIKYQDESSAYPGHYVPLLNEAEVRKQIRRSRKAGRLVPAVNMTESPDSFKIEVAIPGVKREDFLIRSKGNLILISVLHNAGTLHQSERFQLHEFSSGCFDRRIVLPANADTAFIVAEYKAGILSLHVPKSAGAVNNRQRAIVVY